MELDRERENIAAEIQHFYHKHDLGTMMDFLRRLDGAGQYSADGMEGEIVPQTGADLDRKMKIKPPPPVEEILPAIPPLAPLNEIKSTLKKIIDQAFARQQGLDLRDLVKP